MADQITATDDDGRVPDIEFEPMATADEVTTFFRENLDGKILGLKQAMMLALFDRPQFVAFLQSLDDDAKMNVVESATDFAKWAKDMAKLAEASATRSLIAIAEIADMLKPIGSDDPGATAGEAAALLEPAFDAAHAEYRRLKEVERALGRSETLEEEELQEPAYQASLAETDAAFDEMIIIPVADGLRVWAKFAAILDHYHVNGFGLDAGVQEQVFAEAQMVLTGEPQS